MTTHPAITEAFRALLSALWIPPGRRRKAIALAAGIAAAIWATVTATAWLLRTGLQIALLATAAWLLWYALHSAPVLKPLIPKPPTTWPGK